MTTSRTRFHIVLTCILLLIAAGLGRGLVLWDEYVTARDEAGETTREWTRLLEQYTARTFETGDLLADVVIDNVRHRGGLKGFGSSADMRRVLVGLLGRSPGDYLMVVDRDAKPFAVTVTDTPPDVNFSDRDWFRAHSSKGTEIYVGTSIFSRVTHEILFTFSRAIRLSDGTFDGVLQLSMTSAFFEQIRLERSLGPHATFALWKPDGKLIGRSKLTREEAEQQMSSPAIAEKVAAAPDGTFVIISAIDGRERIVSYRSMPKWGVVVTSSMATDAAFADWRRRVNESVGYFLLLVLVATVAGGWAVTSAQKLESAAGDLSLVVAQKDDLLREMHHRVKNNLQMTMSLMRMAARRSDSPPVKQLVADMEERLRSMSLLFEMVYRSDLSGHLSLRDYLRQLIETIEKSFAARETGIVIDLQCDDVRMNADRLGTIGLLVTEVMTNAMKHAFDAQANPRISVTITRREDAIDLIVADNGRGMPAPDGKVRSLGMMMISAFVKQLGGESRFENHAGTRFIARIPVDAPAAQD